MLWFIIEVIVLIYTYHNFILIAPNFHGMKFLCHFNLKVNFHDKNFMDLPTNFVNC